MVLGNSECYGFIKMSSNGEKGSVDNVVIIGLREAIRERLQCISLVDIYIMDKIGVFYYLASNKTSPPIGLNQRKT